MAYNGQQQQHPPPQQEPQAMRWYYSWGNPQLPSPYQGAISKPPPLPPTSTGYYHPIGQPVPPMFPPPATSQAGLIGQLPVYPPTQVAWWTGYPPPLPRTAITPVGAGGGDGDGGPRGPEGCGSSSSCCHHHEPDNNHHRHHKHNPNPQQKTEKQPPKPAEKESTRFIFYPSYTGIFVYLAFIPKAPAPDPWFKNSPQGSFSSL